MERRAAIILRFCIFSTAIQKQPCGILGPMMVGYFHHIVHCNRKYPQMQI